MTVYSVANNKGGSRKTATALNLLHHLPIDIVVDLDKYHALRNLIEMSGSGIEVRTPTSIEEIHEIAHSGKNVLFDCGGFDSDFNRAALSQSDVIITPCNDDPTEQLGLNHFNDTMREVSEMVNEKLTAKVLISGVHHARNDFSSMSELVNDLSHCELLPFVIPHSSKVPTAQFSGNAVTSGTIAAKFRALAKHIQI